MTTMIWDGIEFLHVDEKEAKALVKADKAQIMDGTVDGLSMKFRHEFTGYNVPDAEPVELPGMTKSEEPDPMANHVQTNKLKDWRSYKKMAAEALGKPFNKTTKADVETWLKDGENGSV